MEADEGKESDTIDTFLPPFTPSTSLMNNGVILVDNLLASCFSFLVSRFSSPFTSNTTNTISYT